ncbi:hypothetical protein MRX96_017639 [Rhipicephalus microplus]
MASNNLGENTGAFRTAAESSAEKQPTAQGTPASEVKTAEATTPGPDKACAAAAEQTAPMSSAVSSDEEAPEGAQGRKRRLSSKVVVVAPRSDTALIPPRRHRARRQSSVERLHEASQQALATSGAERYLNLWLLIGVSCGVASGTILRNTLKEPLTKRQASACQRSRGVVSTIGEGALTH